MNETFMKEKTGIFIVSIDGISHGDIDACQFFI